MVVAIGAYFTIQDFPDTAAFLSEEERAFVLFRLKYYSGYSHDHIAGTHQSHATVPVDKVKWKYVKDALRDWQIWVNLIVYWGFNCPIYGVSLFLPTIIKDLGYTNTTAQLLTVPVYVAAAITTILVAWFADRKKIRSPFIIVALFVQLIGFIMCISTGHAGVTYAGIFIAACAMYPTLPSDIIWLGNNLEGSYKRAVGMAIQIGLGNFAGGKSRSMSLGKGRYLMNDFSCYFQLLPCHRCSKIHPWTRVGDWIHLPWNHCCIHSSLYLSSHQLKT